MKTKILLIAFLLLSTQIVVTAEELLVEFLDGILEVRVGSDWIEADVGDMILADALLRLSEDGFAELSLNSTSIIMSKGGTYKAKDLLNSSRELASWNMASLVNSKLKGLSSGQERTDLSAMGVRGAAQEENDIKWVDEAEEYLTKGKESLEKGLYDEAIELFFEGADYAIGEEEQQEYLFYAALGYSSKGDDARALKTLRDIEPNEKAGFFADFVLLKGKLLMENLSFEEARALFERYLENAYKGETAQIVYLLSALCHKSMNDREGALKNLQEAYSIDSGSEYGKTAKQLMESL